MPKYRAVTVTVGILLCCGCHHWGYYPKRQSELNCPTDIRQTIPWCAGEDAVFRCPCGPSSQFYGHKPTCWGHWPAPGEVWRDSYCGCSVDYAAGEEVGGPALAPEPLPEGGPVDLPSGDEAPMPAQPAELPADPLFVPPQPAVTEPSGPAGPTTQGSRPILRQSAGTPKKEMMPKAQFHTGGIRQACHTEEATLEPHAWTGIKFVR